MNWSKFALGLRFAATENDPMPPSFFWDLLFTHLPVSLTHGLYLHGITDLCADREPENAYICVLSNASIRRGKQLFLAIQADSYLCSYLTVFRPFIQTNTLESYQSADFLGQVDDDGRVTGGEVSYSGMCFCGKQMPLLRASSRLCVLIAPDSFRGSLTSAEVTRHLSRAVYHNMPLATVIPCQMADGGEGTMDAIVCPRSGRYVQCSARDCYGEPLRARYGVLPDQTVVIEAAQTCGFRDEASLSDIINASSYGLGEMITHVLDHGYRRIEISLGGATIIDGGTGMLSALGVRFLDATGTVMEGCGKNLADIAAIDTSALHPKIDEAKLILLCDVQNPLLGETGPARAFARQNVSYFPENEELAAIEELEQGLENYVEKVRTVTGKDCHLEPGAGAAGGLGYALHCFCGASITSGIETVMQESGFLRRLNRASLVITGEGSFDEESIQFGKTVLSILGECRKRNVPLAIISGSSAEGISNLMPNQGWAAITCVHSPITQQCSREKAVPLLDEAADRMFRLLRLGMNLGLKYPLLLAEGDFSHENG